MNLEQIRLVLDYPLMDDTTKENLIIQILSRDSKVIPTILSILENERKSSKELILDMNLELSRCHIAIDKPEMIQQKNGFTRDFLRENVKNFYIKYKDVIGHCFNYKFE